MSEIMFSLEVSKITLQLIKDITGNFSKEKKIGSGGYGEVYRGQINGEEIAIKKLFPINNLEDQQFQNEFSSLMMVHHKNIIRLIRYCYETAREATEHNGKLVFADITNRCLCFELMEGGSLAKHISAESCIHDWTTTYKIIKGICEGLHYLHKGRGERNYIYHLDLKPDNILLDKNMVPKIGDFGLSRLFGESKTYETSIAKGTRGFMPPEFIDNHMITPKNDVFSLGVIIFHIMAGEKGYNDYCDLRNRKEFSEENHQEFIESVQEYWKKKMQATVGYKWNETDILGVKKCIEIATSCVQIDRKKRPTTVEIIEHLNELEAMIEKMSRKDPMSHAGQKNSDLNKDIATDPALALRFPFEPKRDVPCCLLLINKADAFVAFNINTDQKKYHAQPNKGIISPCSSCDVTITSQALEKKPLSHDVFIVQGTRVNKDFTSMEITEDFLKNATKVDQLILPIVHV